MKKFKSLRKLKSLGQTFDCARLGAFPRKGGFSSSFLQCINSGLLFTFLATLNKFPAWENTLILVYLPLVSQASGFTLSPRDARTVVLFPSTLFTRSHFPCALLGKNFTFTFHVHISKLTFHVLILQSHFSYSFRLHISQVISRSHFPCSLEGLILNFPPLDPNPTVFSFPCCS